MSSSKPNKKEKNHLPLKAEYCYFGCIAGVFFFIKINVDESLKNLNLGQVLPDGTPKYLSTSKLGFNTGSGYAFEDVFIRTVKANGMEIEQVEMFENGPDFIFNGSTVQLKYGRTPQGVFNSLFKNGKYRYPGQTIITNKENEFELRKLIDLNKHRFKGETVIVNPIGTPKISREEVHRQLHRGWESIQIDAKDIIMDKNSRNNLLVGTVVSFCAIIGLGAILEYLSQAKDEETRRQSKVKQIGSAINRSFKKHWKKGLIFSGGVALITFGRHLLKRQTKRPK